MIHDEDLSERIFREILFTEGSLNCCKIINVWHLENKELFNMINLSVNKKK